MKRFWKNERLVSACLNGVVFLLLFLIFLQCGIFLNGYIKSDTVSGESAFDMRMLSVSAQDAAHSLDESLLMPAQIAISAEGRANAVVNSARVIEDLYSELSPCLSVCLDARPKKENDAMWTLAVTAPDVIYIRYRMALPYQVVHAFAAEESDADAYVRSEQVLLVDELCLHLSDGEASLFVRGENGVYSFSAETDLTMAAFAPYASMYPEVFYPCILSDGDSAVLITERVNAREMLVAGGVGTAILANESHFSEWLRLLSFNPDKLNYHIETDGTAVYVESHGILVCRADSISYAASEDGGADIAEFAFYRGEMDVYAYLRAASALIFEVSSMGTQYTGGDAALQLYSVCADDTSLTLSFCLCADNLPVYYNDSNVAVSMTFADDRLIGLTWQPVYVLRQLPQQACFLEAWSRTALACEDVYLAYRADSGRTRLFAEWIAHRASEG